MLGLSDHQKLILTVLKAKFVKAPPREVTYRNYKHFEKAKFNEDLHQKISNSQINNYNEFESAYLEVLNWHAPLKTKVLRANHSSYVTEDLCTAIMKRSELENICNKDPTTFNLRKYRRQENYCSRLYEKESKKYYNNLGLNFVSDSKKFWTTVKPFFSNKVANTEKVTLVQNQRNYFRR